jgi:phosphoglycolate phosphatase-like HAD superfamily hydrolase
LKQLLLFDIDGTLIDTGGVGLAALVGGLCDSFPVEAANFHPDLDLRGATDAGVIRTLFVGCGIVDSPENRDLFLANYLRRLVSGLRHPTGPCKPRVLPGVQVLLADLAREPDRFVVGLLTGNLEAGAYAKLRQFDLDGYFRFGAFGLDREERLELGPVALERARIATGRDFHPTETIIIGDTPRDIACARALGARCIAVTTGGFNPDEMAPYQPDALISELPSPEEFIAILSAWLPGSPNGRSLPV